MYTVSPQRMDELSRHSSTLAEGSPEIKVLVVDTSAISQEVWFRGDCGDLHALLGDRRGDVATDADEAMSLRDVGFAKVAVDVP